MQNCAIFLRMIPQTLEDHLGGIVTNLQIADLAGGGGVYHAAATFHYRAHRRQATVTGRGITAKQAQHSAIGEALERYSIAWHGTESMLRAKLRDLDQAIDPRAITLDPESGFDPEMPLDFLPGISLSTGHMVPVPAACCLMGYPFLAGEAEFAIADSNGCAAAFTIEEATASAIYELMERDAFANWWQRRQQQPAVRIESFEYEPLTAIRDALRREAGRNLHLFDLTNRFEIPVFAAVAPRLDGMDPIVMSGAHPSPEIAAWKAASEAAQVWHWQIHQGIDPHPFLQPLAHQNLSQQRCICNPTESIHYAVDALLRHGIEPVCIDLARPEVNIPVVRLIAPGMRHLPQNLVGKA